MFYCYSPFAPILRKLSQEVVINVCGNVSQSLWNLCRLMNVCRRLDGVGNSVLKAQKRWISGDVHEVLV